MTTRFTPAAWLERATARRAAKGVFPLRLGGRQVFILPSRFGLLAAGAALVFLLLGLNYQNAPAFALAFLSGALGAVAMVATHRHLRGLIVADVACPPVFAGEPVVVMIALANRSRRRRRGLRGFTGACGSECGELAGGTETVLAVTLPPRPRGRHPIVGLGIDSTEPFGVFRAWSRLGQAVECIVYPAPAAKAPPPPGDLGRATGDGREAQPEDFHGLARYRPGDRPSQIAWHVYSRTGILERKQFAGGASGAVWLDYAATPAADPERRLAVLARWLIDAERSGSMSYGLRLPGFTLAPGRGAAHLARGLRALALYPGPYDETPPSRA